jgi:TPR repeat protein
MVDQDDSSAWSYFRQASEMGDAISTYHLGLMVEGGRIPPETGTEPLTATQWFTVAASRGLGEAMFKLGNDALEEKRYADAEGWLVKGSEVGHPLASLSLAAMYQNGTGVPKDPAKGVTYLRKATESGFPAAFVHLGQAYENGNGVEKNMRKAISWYEQATLRGEPNAMFRLGQIFQDGNGVDADPKRAGGWYVRASQAGHMLAMFELAKIYEEGIGIEKNLERAAYFYQMAARKGLADAQVKLAEFYAEGKGVPRDPLRAYAICLNAEAVSETARKLAEKLVSELSPEQIRQAAAQRDQARGR